MSKSTAELQAELKKLSKKADQRLVRLEKLAETNNDYKSIVTYSYARSQEDIKALTGKEGTKLRFNTKAPDDAIELQKRINAIERFLKSPTSSKKRVDKATKTVNKNMGLTGSDQLSWDEIANFWENEKDGKFEYTANTYKASMEIRKKNITKEKVKEYDEKSFHITGDEVINDKIKEMLFEQGLTVEELFNKG